MELVESRGAAARRKAVREERIWQAVRVPGLASKVQLRHLRRHQDQAQVFRYSAAGTVELRCGGGSKRLCVHLRCICERSAVVCSWCESHFGHMTSTSEIRLAGRQRVLAQSICSKSAFTEYA